MPSEFPESDWKVFRDHAYPGALDRHCRATLDEASRIIANKAQSAHDRYGSLFQLITERDKELVDHFDCKSRSSAFLQILAFRRLGLVPDEVFARFSAETRRRVDEIIHATKERRC